MTGFGESRNAQRRGDVGRQQLAPGDRPADLRAGLLGQVVARAERPPGSLEHDHPDVGVGLGGIERRRRARRRARPLRA